MKGKNVLSLFDGMSGGQITLKEQNVKVNKYFAAEIDKFAVEQAQLNFPETIQLASVVDIRRVICCWKDSTLLKFYSSTYIPFKKKILY